MKSQVLHGSVCDVISTAAAGNWELINLRSERVNCRWRGAGRKPGFHRKFLSGFSFFVFCFCFVADTLKCYQCTSTESWEHCDQNKKTVTCPAGADRCGKMYAKGVREVFARGCDTAQQCREACDTPGLSECHVDCCDSDECNGAAGKVVSVVFLVACAVFAFMAV